MPQPQPIPIAKLLVPFAKLLLPLFLFGVLISAASLALGYVASGLIFGFGSRDEAWFWVVAAIVAALGWLSCCPCCARCLRLDERASPFLRPE